MHKPKTDEEEKPLSSFLRHEFDLQVRVCWHSLPPWPFTILSFSIPSNCPALISCVAFKDGILKLFFSLLFCPPHIVLPILPWHLPQRPPNPDILYLSTDEVGKLLFLPLPCPPLSLPFDVGSKSLFKVQTSMNNWSKLFFLLFTLYSVSDCNIQENLCHCWKALSIYKYRNYKLKISQFNDHFSGF